LESCTFDCSPAVIQPKRDARRRYAFPIVNPGISGDSTSLQIGLLLLFHLEPGFTDPVINRAIIRGEMKSPRDNSISARGLVSV